MASVCTKCGGGAGTVQATVVTASGATTTETQDCPRCGGTGFEPPQRPEATVTGRASDDRARE